MRERERIEKRMEKKGGGGNISVWVRREVGWHGESVKEGMGKGGEKGKKK